MKVIFPNEQIPKEPGCLSVRIHAGSWPKWGGGQELPIIGIVGTSDPSRWVHVLWFEGKAFVARLCCDVPNHRPQYSELKSHYERYPQMWEEVRPVNESAP